MPIFKVKFFNGNTLLKPPSYDPNFKGSNVKCGIIKFKNKIFGKINISSSTLLIQSYLNVRATCVTIMGLWSGLVWSGLVYSDQLDGLVVILLPKVINVAIIPSRKFKSDASW